MKRPITCGFCGEYLGTCHGNERMIIHTQHFKEKHSFEYSEMKKAQDKFHELKKRYKFAGVV